MRFLGRKPRNVTDAEDPSVREILDEQAQHMKELDRRMGVIEAEFNLRRRRETELQIARARRVAS